MPPSQEQPAATLSPRFKAVFFTVVVLTVLFIIGDIVLSICFPIDDPASRMTDVIDLLKTSFITGIGAIVGLLGGQTL